MERHGVEQGGHTRESERQKQKSDGLKKVHKRDL